MHQERHKNFRANFYKQLLILKVFLVDGQKCLIELIK